jgi:predicted PurR-regulated permease PerM
VLGSLFGAGFALLGTPYAILLGVLAARVVARYEARR